jgi:hypothetical protein
MELAKKVETVYVPVSVKDELPEDKTAVFILENRGSSSLMPRMNLAYFEHPTNFNTRDEEDNYPTHWLKEQNNKYILSEEELRLEIKRAYIHGQSNARMMEAGLERDEVEDYVNHRMM